MLSVITAAEQQYRHEAARRDRDHAIRLSIRERRAAPAPAGVASLPRRRPVAVPWARPIGAHLAGTEHIVACAA